jgi:glycosyltransferase involved in cell wall biosynthesis
VRGNAITVARIFKGLRAQGFDLRVWDGSAVSAEAIAREVEAERPALIHAFHAYRMGPLALRLARRLEVPLVVTLTGTDANHDLFDPDRAEQVRRVLEGAAAVTAFDGSIVERVAGALPDVRRRLSVVPQAVSFDDPAGYDLNAVWPLPADRVLLLLPAGIRPVKAPRSPLVPLDALAAAEPRLRLAYAGPIIDEPEGAALLAELARRPWARYLGAVPHERMRSLLDAADVVLNCSLSEGGMANSVLEALARGRAVLAADIPGNRTLVEEGVTGLLYDGPAALRVQAERLVRDGALRARLGAAGRARVAREFPAAREIDGYVEVYRGRARVTA